MKKEVSEENIYRPNSKNFKTTMIRGREYYFFTNPSDGKRVYAPSESELLNKLKTLQGELKTLFTNDLTLLDALLCWNQNVRYASLKDKTKFADLLNSVKMQDEESVLNKNYYESTGEDITNLKLVVCKFAHVKIQDYFFERMEEFKGCMKWCGIKVQPEINKVIEDYKNGKGTLIRYNPGEVIENRRKSNNNHISQNDFEQIDRELTVRNTVEKSIYNDEYIVILITTHTGIYAKNAFYLKWENVDFENQQIKTDSYAVDMDDLLVDVLMQYRQKMNVKSEGESLFPSADRGKSYSNILTLFKIIKKNSLISQDISLRDLSLAQGKKMLKNGVNPDTVCSILDIKKGGTIWMAMELLEFEEAKEEINEKPIEDISDGFTKVIKKLSKEQQTELLRYAEYLSKMK